MSTPVTIGGIVAPDSELARKAGALAEQAHSKVLLMNAPETRRFSVETIAECVPAVATLITGAVATFDADPGASRRYLMRASAILQACTAHESEGAREARSRRGLAHWQLTRILDYIEQHLADRITGEGLAGLIGVSIGQLFRAFKASVGMPPLQYVASRRSELVCLLMRTTQEPLCQIAIAAGFCDQSHLCRVFRRVLGATPAAWRRENAASPGSHTREGPIREIERHHASESIPADCLKRQENASLQQRRVLELSWTVTALMAQRFLCSAGISPIE